LNPSAAPSVPSHTGDNRHEDSGNRIARLQARYQTERAMISVQRARYYTESWLATQDSGTALPVRVALAMKNVYEKMDHTLDPDERIAGTWTEYFLGVPIDIERGVFNQVFESELTRGRMLVFRGASLAKGLAYMLRKGMLGDFLRNQRTARAGGTAPLNMELKTMSERPINPFHIAEGDRRELLNDLLPRWKGKTLVDRQERELAASGLHSRDMHDCATATPGNTSRQVWMLATCATIATIQVHVILDYERVLEKGLAAMQEDVRRTRDSTRGRPGPEDDFLHSLEVALEGVTLFSRRLADRIEREIRGVSDPHRRTILEGMLHRCRRVPLQPADGFQEAVQSLWTVKTAVELAHPVNLHCFGRLDQTLYPYYRKDVDQGRITRDEARELLEELLLKIMSQNIRPESNILGNYYHRFLGSSPVTVGGVHPDGTDATNDLSHLFVEAAHRARAVTNLSVRVHEKTPDALLLQVADALHKGTSSYSLFNDEINIEAMRRHGFSDGDSRNYAIMGCVETTCPGKTGSMSACALLLNRLLDLVMRNGDSAILAGTIHGEGLRTGDPDTFQHFEEFLDAFQKQGAYFIRKIVEGCNLKDRLYEEHLPAPIISAFVDGCLDKKKDVTRGGAVYDLAGISMINAIGNLVDSLLVIKRLVFEQKRIDFKTLLEAVDNDFRGHEDLLRQIRKLPGKWGNGDPETDALAARVMKGLFDETYKYRNHKGGPFTVFAISMITHTLDGRLSIAGPDGRRAASPYAASCNPYNVEKSGVTAALRSVAALPHQDMMGCAVNVKFHPSAIGTTPEARAKWVALVRAYFRMGGPQIQPTVASAATLREAKQDPDKHRDLIVKVGGYSTYFVDLGREIQDEVIARTEHL